MTGGRGENNAGWLLGEAVPKQVNVEGIGSILTWFTAGKITAADGFESSPDFDGLNKALVNAIPQA